MKNTYASILTYIITGFFITLITSCGTNSLNQSSGSDEDDEATQINRDFSGIQEKGTLKVLITYSSTSYFLYRGQPMGFEYEILNRMADNFGLKLDLILVNNMDSVFSKLNNGEADMIAHGLTITSDRKKKVNFTDYLYLTSQVLVQRKPDNWRKMSWAKLQSHLYHDAIDLIGDTISVRENSSYIKRLDHLSQELGGKIHIDTLDGTLSTEEIIQKVADGELKYTVADKNLAKVSSFYNPNLNIDVPLSFSQRIAWAVRKTSPQLLDSINQWLEKEKEEATYYVIYNRYFKNKRSYKKRIKSEFMSLNGNQISKYDDLIKEHAKKIGWDWRLVASLIYQESRFKNKAKSWAGAKGLMQIMPRTAKSLGVNNPMNPEQSIRGGTKYLKQLYDRFEEIPDSLERIKFSMAAYNCGYYHIKDAQFLAKEKNLDPTIWDDNVEKMILALSYPRNYNKPGVKYGYVRGTEPTNYVEHIFNRYDHYKKFIEI